LVSSDPSVQPHVEFRLLEHESDQRRMVAAVQAAMGLLADPDVRKLRDDVFTIVPSSMVRRLNRPGRTNHLFSRLLAMALDAPLPIRRLVAGRAGKLLSEAALKAGKAEEALADLSPIFHPAGTCAMGSDSDPLAVLDPHCRVRGTTGLYVMDASVMPLIPTGNTCLPTMMIAERAAHLFIQQDA
jgi:5-(hydroxymethyl)furfural/furfural oxidase